MVLCLMRLCRTLFGMLMITSMFPRAAFEHGRFGAVAAAHSHRSNQSTASLLLAQRFDCRAELLCIEMLHEPILGRDGDGANDI